MPTARRLTLLKRTLLATAAAALLAPVLRAGDWPQFRGPNHDGVSNESIAKKWPAAGPKVVWKIPVGAGLGSFAVAGKGAYLFVAKGAKEACVRLDADTGKEQWSADIDRNTTETASNGGQMPRSTPAIDGDKVYVLGTFLKFVCLNAADGKVAWQHDLMSEFNGQKIQWDNAASAVIDGDKVFVAGGGGGQSFLAFKKDTGDLAWKVGDEKLTHATPTVATIGGVRQVIFFAQSGLVGVRAADGEILWRQKFPFSTSTASTPIVGGKDDDIVYCSAGYGSGTGAYQIKKDGDKFTATQLWFVQDPKKKGAYAVNHWTTPVYKDGYLYGIYGFKEFGEAPLKCIDIAKGKEAWSHPGFGSGGGTILVGDNLVVQSDTGSIVLVEATPKGYHPLAQAKPLNPQAPYGTSVKERCWTMAVVANGRIYARSTSEAVCLDVAAK